MKIQKVIAEEILDSRGNPTIATRVLLADGSEGWAAVPSGASTGIHEAHELRDGDTHRFGGQGVLRAIDNVNTLLSPAIMGKDAEDQEGIDKALIELDGTKEKKRLGANAILSVSLSVARAAATAEKKELYEYLTRFAPDFTGTYVMPIPEMNVMNGAKHANWATDIQEYMLFPLGASSIRDAIRMNVEIYHALQKVIQDKGYTTTVGDEGGFAPLVSSNEEPFELMTEAVVKAGYQAGKDIWFGIDAAASEFYLPDENSYRLFKEGKTVSSEELLTIYQELQRRHPIVSLEDIFSQDDWEAFQKSTAMLGSTTQIVGDDLYCTNVERLQQGIDSQATNAILIKLNQIGTLSETIEAILLAKRAGMQAIVSHRSGETEDTFIADLAVAMGVGQLKSGAPCRSERVAKYNRLMHIERQVGEQAIFASFPFPHGS